MGVVIVEGNGQFWGLKCGVSHCKQWGLCCIVVRERRALSKLLLEYLSYFCLSNGCVYVYASAVLDMGLCLCVCVCLSHAGIVSKRLLGSS